MNDDGPTLHKQRRVSKMVPERASGSISDSIE